MKESLHNNELESFLYKQVKDHRMYPADQVWRNIQKEIHGEGKWPALTYISIFIITALSVCTMMVKPEERLHKNTIVYPVQKEETTLEKTKTNNSGNAAATPVQYAYTDRITQQTMQSVSDAIVAREEKQNAHPSFSINNESLLTVEHKPAVNINSSLEAAVKTSAVKPFKPAQAIVANATVKEDKAGVATITQLVAGKPASRYFSTIGLMNFPDVNKSPDNQSSYFGSDEIWRNYPLLSARELWRRNLAKLSFQFYITPSVSYRRLNDANGKTARSYTAFPRATNYQLDINRLVSHQAEMGAEVGFALGYKLSNRLTAKGGFQFNVRQYSIKAYSVSVADPSVNTTTDNNVAGTVSGSDEIAVNNSYLTSADAATASSPVSLNNRYYELSVPVGIDWRIMTSGNGRLAVNAAASLQPTYTFDKEPFVVTTDYKSYTDGASIMRNWNLNSNVEAYISYKMGTFLWQVGPQFRYQHFSTYTNAYPIREHLLDYGVKIGFTKSLN